MSGIFSVFPELQNCRLGPEPEDRTHKVLPYIPKSGSCRWLGPASSHREPAPPPPHPLQRVGGWPLGECSVSGEKAFPPSPSGGPRRLVFQGPAGRPPRAARAWRSGSESEPGCTVSLTPQWTLRVSGAWWCRMKCVVSFGSFGVRGMASMRFGQTSDKAQLGKQYRVPHKPLPPSSAPDRQVQMWDVEAWGASIACFLRWGGGLGGGNMVAPKPTSRA